MAKESRQKQPQKGPNWDERVQREKLEDENGEHKETKTGGRPEDEKPAEGRNEERDDTGAKNTAEKRLPGERERPEAEI